MENQEKQTNVLGGGGKIKCYNREGLVQEKKY